METKKVKAWTPAHTAMAAITHKFDFTLAFDKESDNRWYVDIPYPFSHANLEMVCGADDFLDALCRGQRRVLVRFCDHPFDGCEHEWHAVNERESYGQTYDVTSPAYNGKAWLCPVTLYVLGHFPKHIHIQQLNIDTLPQETREDAADAPKHKSVVVVSPYAGDGKTTLVETLVGRPLEWGTEDVVDNHQWHHADISYGDIGITISECFTLDENRRDLWPDVRERMKKADLILHLQDSSEKVDGFTELDMCIQENYDFEQEIKQRKFIVFTKSDQKPDFKAWWDSLSPEQQEELNKHNQQYGNPRFANYAEAIANEHYLCAGCWLSYAANDNNDVYEVSCKTKEGITELRNRIASFLLD